MIKQTIYYTLLLPVLAVLLAACDGITYDGTFSEEGYYTGMRRAYFDKQDTVRSCSFALSGIDDQTRVLLIPVRMMGPKAATPIRLKLEVDPASTAQKGTQYELPDEIAFNTDSVNAYIPLTVLRAGLPKDSLGNVFLTLNLQPTDEYTTEKAFNNSITIKMNDFLAKPAWWDFEIPGFSYRDYYWGPYTSIKYLKWLEFYDMDPDKLNYVMSYTYDWTVTLPKVVEYFREHPEYEQTFGTAYQN